MPSHSSSWLPKAIAPGLHGALGRRGIVHGKDERFLFLAIQQAGEIVIIGKTDPQGVERIEAAQQADAVPRPLEETVQRVLILENEDPLALKRAGECASESRCFGGGRSARRNLGIGSSTIAGFFEGARSFAERAPRIFLRRRRARQPVAKDRDQRESRGSKTIGGVSCARNKPRKAEKVTDWMIVPPHRLVRWQNPGGYAVGTTGAACRRSC